MRTGLSGQAHHAAGAHNSAAATAMARVGMRQALLKVRHVADFLLPRLGGGVLDQRRDFDVHIGMQRHRRQRGMQFFG